MNWMERDSSDNNLVSGYLVLWRFLLMNIQCLCNVAIFLCFIKGVRYLHILIGLTKEIFPMINFVYP